MFSELLVVLLALVSFTTGESFADWMTKDFCDRELAVGQVSLVLNFTPVVLHLEDFKQSNYLPSTSIDRRSS
jgi:hypothetical protein